MNTIRKQLFAAVAAGLMLVMGGEVQAKVYVIDVPDPATWSNSAIRERRDGDTLLFKVPVIVNRNYGYSGFTGLTMSVRRIYSPTNQALPLSEAYSEQIRLNSTAPFTLTGCGYKRNGERLHNLKAVKMNTDDNLTLKYVSGTWEGNNTREKLKNNPPSVDMNGENNEHNVLVCGANLEYYLVQSLGTGYGPDSYSEHQKQRTKVKNALATIHADVYGLVEIEQGQAALAEIAADLTALTGDHYDYIQDKGVLDGSYTKAGFVYNSDRIQPVGILSENNSIVKHRKMVQGFILIENNERFIYSINHFKAKSGSASGRNADQGDGQGSYNYNRVQESMSVLQNVEAYVNYYEDNDLLIMGDLNAYAKEDPIQKFVEAGMYDLHRYFHADSSYSYVFGEQAGYLDHAIANKSLLRQVTGMGVWHVNSDESDEYTYDKSSDLSIFRYSDHDPVLVGLRLDSTLSIPLHGEELIEHVKVVYSDGDIMLTNVGELGEQNGYYEIYNTTGTLVQSITRIEESPCPIAASLPAGIYIVRVYYADRIKSIKLLKK